MSQQRRIKITFDTSTHEFKEVKGADHDDPTIPGDADLHQKIDEVVAMLGGGKTTSDTKPVEKQKRHMLTRQRVVNKR